ncbi:MAG: hypothetical protein R2932_03280 [Caldilineaceae bacterium]
MSILTLSNIGQSYGDFDVFLGISAGVQNDGKVGLVGPNGIGKTTLLRIRPDWMCHPVGKFFLHRAQN